jgi:hypothetical protein
MKKSMSILLSTAMLSVSPLFAMEAPPEQDTDKHIISHFAKLGPDEKEAIIDFAADVVIAPKNRAEYEKVCKDRRIAIQCVCTEWSNLLEKVGGPRFRLFISSELMQCFPDFPHQYTEEMRKSFPFKKKTDAIKLVMATYPTASELLFLAPPTLNQKESFSSGVTAAPFDFLPFFQLGDSEVNDLFFAALSVLMSERESYKSPPSPSASSFSPMTFPSMNDPLNRGSFTGFGMPQIFNTPPSPSASSFSPMTFPSMNDPLNRGSFAGFGMPQIFNTPSSNSAPSFSPLLAPSFSPLLASSFSPLTLPPMTNDPLDFDPSDFFNSTSQMFNILYNRPSLPPSLPSNSPIITYARIYNDLDTLTVCCPHLRNQPILDRLWERAPNLKHLTVLPIDGSSGTSEQFTKVWEKFSKTLITLKWDGAALYEDTIFSICEVILDEKTPLMTLDLTKARISSRTQTAEEAKNTLKEAAAATKKKGFVLKID